MQNITITLSTPVTFHNEVINKISIRPPRTRLYLRLGEPRVIVRNSDGAGYYVDKDDVIRNYIAELVDHEGGELLVDLLDLVDGKKIKGAILSFFDQADAMIFAQKSASSSST